MKNEKLIKSNFNRNEKFTCKNIPKHFDSITEQSIRNVKKYCAQVVRNKYNSEHTARTLRAMIETIDGNFDQLYAQLEGDYAARIGNLSECKLEQINKTKTNLTNFSLTIVNHNNAFENFKENVETFNGNKVDESLKYPNAKLEKFNSRLDKIMEKKNEEKL